MTSTELDAKMLSELPVASASSLSIDTLTFDYLSMTDNDTLTVMTSSKIDTPYVFVALASN